jgi:phosphoribosylformimino-5-aminoimidazole carboxamide ribotide isomerase
MIVYPAIDLKDGAAVRLLRGEMGRATLYNPDPAAQARDFADAGFQWLHLVDLNGAFEGRPVNAGAVEAILAAVSLPVQLGGGIRDMATVARWLEAGVARVILGTAAVKTPALVSEACRAFPGRIAVGIDARGGRVAVEGWAEESEVLAADLARRFEDEGVAAVIYTDIERDGALAGVNVEATAELAHSVALPVIASGGVSSLDDIAALLAVSEPGIAGVICGRALYDGRIDAASALALVAGSRATAGVRC